MLGNETTGDKPWQGYISKLYIADRAISQNDVLELFNTNNYLDVIGNSLIASYQLTNQNKYQDTTGQLPELLSQGKSAKIKDSKGVALSSSYWLTTGIPATLLSKRIRQTSEFTIITSIATTDTTQTGPARIISLSSDILRRNFTLGQQENHLDLRIRSPITGENATDVQLSIPNIFTNAKFHDIVINYYRSNIQIYIDKLDNVYSFNLLQLIPIYQKIFYYALTFIPLGICLTFLTLLVKRKIIVYRLLLTSGILLPSLIVESILIIYAGKDISWIDLLLSIFFISITVLMLRLRASALLKKAA